MNAPEKRPRGRQQRGPVKSESRVGFDVTPDELARINRARGKTPRAVYVRALVLAALPPEASDGHQ